MVATPVAPGQSVADTPPARRRDLRGTLTRVVVAALGGGAVFLSFPPRTVWWLAPVGFAVLGVLLHGRRARAGFGLGLVWGLGFMVPLLRWTGEFVGLVAWLPLALLCALLIAVGTAAMAVVSRLPGAPLWMALVWVADEALRAVVPFGGFPWGKIAFGQPEGWYLPLASVGGAPLIGFAVALTGLGAAHLLRQRAWSGRGIAAAAVVLPLAAGVGASALVHTNPDQGTATVAAIQGNVPRAGLDFNAQRRAVLDNHVKRTLQLADDVRAGRAEQPDLVIWPENSSDIDPFRNADAAARIRLATETIGAPIAVGAVVIDPDDRLPRNTVVLYEPGRGATDTYTKRQLQPFGETMPYRSFFRIFSETVDRAGTFQPGTDPEGFTMGPAKVAIDTCYEVAFDGVVRDSVAAGANMIAIPTNNATFGYTEMTYQQLAMSRVRAVEYGKTVVVAATSGVSAIVQPDGSVTARTGMFTPDALVATVPLRGEATLATRLGAWPEWVMTALGLLAVAFSVTTKRRSRPTPEEGVGEEETDGGPAGAA
ncbi:apolipoprotein N-acyltransferase [Saccharothrix ecbatanensis]|uniref:Apolipoprotein N-acyltransferase n=1 Tax=Saccharothrix ecbatanensis TaxID=1105145 RepID=A0A7W9HIF6_9PSEU|nr:apolipoprotein N-acyltransferase [Saccharothrix ecbatanensis]MBB5802551.1 apolipoprotein N-acyltransferase [Saccharothrix ecbatanensis]